MESGAPSITALNRGFPYSAARAGTVVRNGTISWASRTVCFSSGERARSRKSMDPPVMATSSRDSAGTGRVRYFMRSEKL